MNQKGVIHLVLLLVLIVAVALSGSVYFGLIKNPLSYLPFNLPLVNQGPKVDLKTEYKNPFDQKTQYVNPFETYKNPFVVNR